jgi:hypothetical protein
MPVPLCPIFFSCLGEEQCDSGVSFSYSICFTRPVMGVPLPHITSVLAQTCDTHRMSCAGIFWLISVKEFLPIKQLEVSTGQCHSYMLHSCCCNHLTTMRVTSYSTELTGQGGQWRIECWLSMTFVKLMPETSCYTNSHNFSLCFKTDKWAVFCCFL